MTTSVDTAMIIASTAHGGALDKNGVPYILHPIRVMNYLDTDDTDLMAIAILHDVVEDTDWTFGDLQFAGVNDRIITALKLLTHAQDVSYVDYIQAIVDSGNKDAIRVKMADIRDNTDFRRLPGVTSCDTKRLKRYAKAYDKLKIRLRDL